MLNLFHEIAGAQVVLRKNGVFYQVPVFRRTGNIYAKFSGGYIRLGGQDFTSAPNVSWADLDLPVSVCIRKGQFGEPIYVGEGA